MPSLASQARRAEFPFDYKVLSLDRDFLSRLAAGIDGRSPLPRIGASSFASLTSALMSGVKGLRWGTTSPIECVTSGSTIGIALTVSVRPSTAASLAGITLAHL